LETVCADSAVPLHKIPSIVHSAAPISLSDPAGLMEVACLNSDRWIRVGRSYPPGVDDVHRGRWNSRIRRH